MNVVIPDDVLKYFQIYKRIFSFVLSNYAWPLMMFSFCRTQLWERTEGVSLEAPQTEFPPQGLSQAAESRVPVKKDHLFLQIMTWLCHRAFQVEHQEVSQFWPCHLKENESVWRGAPGRRLWSVWTRFWWGNWPLCWQQPLVGQQERQEEQGGGNKGEAME